MNSTNLDFTGLKYNFSNITNIRLHFCNFDVHHSLSIFHTLDQGFTDQIDQTTLRKRIKKSCYINHNFFSGKEKILDINIKSTINKVRLQKEFPSKIVPLVSRIKRLTFASILARAARVSPSTLCGLLLLVTRTTGSRVALQS